jgi:pimeloyl-ACP methyl ester carboxylesterase
MYEDYYAHLDRLFVPDAVRQLQIPFLIIHGTKDETVPVANAIEMHTWNKGNRLFLIEGANHNFGAKHPWTEGEALSEDTEDLLKETVEFYKEIVNHI